MRGRVRLILLGILAVSDTVSSNNYTDKKKFNRNIDNQAKEDARILNLDLNMPNVFVVNGYIEINIYFDNAKRKNLQTYLLTRFLVYCCCAIFSSCFDKHRYRMLSSSFFSRAFSLTKSLKEYLIKR